jgi:hypothetical protein
MPGRASPSTRCRNVREIEDGLVGSPGLTERRLVVFGKMRS